MDDTVLDTPLCNKKVGQLVFQGDVGSRLNRKVFIMLCPWVIGYKAIMLQGK